jgi:hypothetical protein
MKLAIVAVAVLGFVSTSEARQAALAEYLITPHVFEAAGERSTDLIGDGTQMLLRTQAGEPASVTHSGGTSGIGLVVVPTDLGSGRVALHAEVTVRRDGQVTTSTFDVLSGAGTQTPTIATRDTKGRFLVGPTGGLIYATFDVTRR